MNHNIKQKNELAELKGFTQGIIPFLERFMDNFKIMYNILNANLLSYEEKNKILYELKEVELSLKEILNHLKNIIIEISQNAIIQEANREYYSFFKDEPNSNKINFIILVLYYIKLNELYHFILEKLDHIKKSLIPKLSEQTIFYQQFVDFQMKTCYIKLQKIYSLLKRLEILINLKKHKEKEKLKNIFELVKYSPHIEYKYSLIFKEDLKDYIQSFFPEEKEEERILNSNDLTQLENLNQVLQTNKEILKEEIYKEDKQYIKNNILDTSGKYLWNSSMYYFLSYDIQKYQKEENFFINVFYIDTHLGANPQLVRSKIVRTLLKKDKILYKEEVKNQYRKFLDALFDLNKQILILNFHIPSEWEILFLYHLGPLVFFHINKQYLLDLKTGSIHQIVNEKKNLIRRVIPFEFIKKHLFDWWINHILNSLSEEDKNNYFMYQKLITHIQKIIFELQKEFNKNYPQEDPHYSNPKFIAFLKDKIGNMNLLLIQRYLNIFKHIEIS
ncbi:MAG: hypothetical protein KatS3mg129_0573 [Leptospiraceae bacterium]|nr:MAG: hypothetical protein KatS3mg129_0573 [Leptospiraceae bacterium]